MIAAVTASRNGVVTGDWQTVAARNLASAWLTPAEAQGHRTSREAMVWAADNEAAHPLLNSATLLAPLADRDAPALVARLQRFYAAGDGASWALWSAWPTPDLGPLGGTLVGQPPLMIRPAGAFPPA